VTLIPDLPTDSPTDQSKRLGVEPLVVFAICWIMGVALGHLPVSLAFWLILAGCFLVVAVAWGVRRGPIAARSWSLLAVVAVAAAWTIVQQDRVAGDDVVRYLVSGSQLAQVVGVIDEEPRLTNPKRGDFGKFNHRSPATVFVVKIESIEVDGENQAASGRLLARINQADHRIRLGDRVRLSGWLRPMRGRSNPGGFDYQRHLASRGIHGRMSMPSSGNCKILQRDAAGWHHRLRRWVSTAALMSLRLGMDPNQEQMAFLEAILLGRRNNASQSLDEPFRRVGLAHLLAISGAHLAILLGMVWVVARCVTHRPPRAAGIVLVVLALYLLAVPFRIPIVRAALMAAIWCIGYITGRSVGGLNLLSAAAMAVLIWRPSELFFPGFQLSFSVVAGLLLFAGPVARWLWPVADDVAVHSLSIRHRVVRLIINYGSVNLVAFLAAAPLVAFHFRMFSPLTVLVSLLALPWVTAVLAVGYLKIMLGLLLPSFGLLLVGPLESLAYWVTSSVRWVSQWPIATMAFSGQPSVVWMVASMAVIAALLGGWFARRRLALTAAVVLCTVQLLATTVPAFQGIAALWPGYRQVPLTLNMFSVGDGSCYLVRLNAPIAYRASSAHTPEHGKLSQLHVLMFDCGSQAYMQVGAKSIVPALEAMQVRAVDTLIISHADMDHFNGSLAVVDHVGVARVLMPPQMFARAQKRPQSAVGYFVNELMKRRVPIQTVSKGWHETHGDAQLEILWPPSNLAPAAVNDTSLVLSITVAGRRVMLNGDIGQEAITSLIKEGLDLHADVCDLPHHGSFVAASPEWLTAADPAVVLQSSGSGRLRIDKWARLFDHTPIKRFVSDRVGMVELLIAADGRITTEVFRNRGQSELP